MIKVEVTGQQDVQKLLGGIARDLQGKVLQPAINKVADKARAEINRAIPEEFAVKASEVRSAIELRRASGGNLQAVISIFGSQSKRGRSMNLIHFLAAMQAAGRAVKTRGSKAKVKDIKGLGAQLGFMIKRAGGLKKIEGAFIGNKGRTIFRRVGKGRLPIEPLQVIGFSQMFNTRRISSRILAKIETDLPLEVNRAIKMLTDRGVLP